MTHELQEVAQAPTNESIDERDVLQWLTDIASISELIPSVVLPLSR